MLYCKGNCVCHSHVLQYRFLLSDFGFSTSFNREKSTARRGAEGYRAPELYRMGESSEKIDIWAFGCIIFQVASRGRSSVFSSDHEAVTYALDDKSLPQLTGSHNSELSSESLHQLNKLIKECLTVSPKTRPSAEALYDDLMKWEKRLLTEAVDLKRRSRPRQQQIRTSRKFNERSLSPRRDLN